MSHRIRLHGPWEVQPHHPHSPPGRMTIPGTLREGGWNGYVGGVLFVRRFGRPTNLDANEQVWLLFERVAGLATIRLNGELLGSTDGQAQFNVTERLAARNELLVDAEVADDCGGLVGSVILEIKASGAA
jgi:hypothetical protein